MDSKIGTRGVEVLLSVNGSKEEWVVKCSNAGALLKGIGDYDSMKSDNLILNVHASRKEKKLVRLFQS